MSLRINKALGYGLIFKSTEHLKEVLNPSFYNMLSLEGHKKGLPLQKYLEWLMSASDEEFSNIEDTYVIDSLMSEGKEGSKACLNDLVNIIEDIPYLCSETGEQRLGVGLLIRPMQTLGEVWFRRDDTIDYYSHPVIRNSWVESDYPFFPYDTPRRVHRETGKESKITTSEFVYMKQKNLSLKPDWEMTVPAMPNTLSEIVKALKVFRLEDLVLPPVIAVWWE